MPEIALAIKNSRVHRGEKDTLGSGHKSTDRGEGTLKGMKFFGLFLLGHEIFLGDFLRA